jgi:hypothetical protein
MKSPTENTTGCGCGDPSSAAPLPEGSTCGAFSPAVKEPALPACGVSQSEGARTERRQMEIELLYLDLSRCVPCRGADASLEEALDQVSAVLRAMDVDVALRKTHVQSLEQAQELGFVSSPTIRINGRDIQQALQETHCASCSALSGMPVDCRSWVYQGQQYSSPPKALIIDAILRALYGDVSDTPETAGQDGAVPENLQRFFAAHQGETPPQGSCALA